MLWEELSQERRCGVSRDYTISTMAASRQECEASARKTLSIRVEWLRRQGPNVTVEQGYATLTGPGRNALTHRYLCLPDTIDPLGPKAK